MEYANCSPPCGRCYCCDAAAQQLLPGVQALRGVKEDRQLPALAAMQLTVADLAACRGAEPQGPGVGGRSSRF